MIKQMRVVRDSDLSVAELEALRKLFDQEYLSTYGPWNRNAPYGYSPADFHILAFHGSTLVAHVGLQRRVIAVGAQDVVVAGTGGVLVDERARGAGLGRETMQHAQTVMREEAEVDFGYLGCRKEVMPFYESAGWTQIYAVERSVSRVDQKSVIISRDGPILICCGSHEASQWPRGNIDLRGTPW